MLTAPADAATGGTESAAAMQDILPRLEADLIPPAIHGIAALTECAYRGGDPARLADAAAPCPLEAAALAARSLDLATLHQIRFAPDLAQALRIQALHQHRLFRTRDRLGRQSAAPLRLLAVMAAGDFMANAPLDFITAHGDIRLDLLYVPDGVALPEAVPDHDVAFFALGDAESPAIPRFAALYRAWPRPPVNDPARLPGLARDALAAAMADIPGLVVPPTRRVDRAGLLGLPDRPWLLRPRASHAGQGLVRAAGRAAIAAFLAATGEETFFATEYVDYAGADGMFRKYRIAFLAGQPMLCHMAVSDHWMVHYLNAGMSRFPARRAEEAAAMAGFDTGFARRHAGALTALAQRIGLDYASIDCAETRDGRLLLFEADAAAILHLMDPPGLFPYKQAPMRALFARFEASLRARAGLV
ncbi:MAG: hypothetical protein KGL12_07360 [Rhodospirillales bacterium]|nr:hypothetical protein [Rhodospirillales bacterium]